MAGTLPPEEQPQGALPPSAWPAPGWVAPGHWPPWQTWPPPVARLIVAPPRRVLSWDHPGLLAALLGGSFILALILGAPVFILNWRPGLFLVEVLAFLAPAWVYMRFLHGRWEGVFAVRRRTAVGLVLAVPMAVSVGFIAGVFVESLFESLLPEETLRRIGEFWKGLALCRTAGDWTWTLLGIVVAPAVTEEVFFRGVIQRGLQRRWRRRPALVVTALIFAGFHLDPLRFVLLFALGLEFGWLYQRTGSVWPGVVAHGINNLLPVLAVNSPQTMNRFLGGLDGLSLVGLSALVGVGSLLIFGVVTRRRRLPVAQVIVLPGPSPGGPAAF